MRWWHGCDLQDLEINLIGKHIMVSSRFYVGLRGLSMLSRCSVWWKDMGLGAPGVKSYSLLIENLSRHNLGDRANALFREAVARGVPLTQGVYKVDKRYVKAKKEKKAKKRLTLPEKMRLKSKRLSKLRMSFIKKPRRRMQA
jgi:hypothetical protein